jgi:exonuclease SbcC
MDGTPCPVCGSKEHPAIAGHAKGMDECEDNEDNEDDKDIDNLSVKLKKQMEFLAELSANRGNIIKAQGTLRDAHLKTIDSKRILSGYLEELGIKNASEEYARLELNEHKSQKLRIEIDNRRLENEKVRKEIEVTIEKLQNINNKLSEIEAVGKNLKSQKDERETRIKNIAGENDINVEIISVEQRMEKLRNDKKQLFDSVNVLQQKLNELVISKETYENQLSIYLQAVKDESERLECELNRKGFDGIDEAVNSIINEDDKRQLSSQIEEYEEKAKGLTIQIGTIDKKLNGEILTREDWLKISADFNTARKNKEESISLFEKAKGQYEHTLKNFEKWLVLNMENKKYNYKKDMLQDIQRLLKGNGFVEFISEERLRYIAREATETLEVLSNYRYALELDVENGFVIRDNANGGAIRLVSTLSGGETFLTSLSLALALSKQIQLKGQSPLEFFFLDEGFGTLDIDLLDTVIDALERLSNTSRVIGLISHVPELKNRIMRKLIVTQPNLGKGSRITIERA